MVMPNAAAASASVYSSLRGRFGLVMWRDQRFPDTVVAAFEELAYRVNFSVSSGDETLPPLFLFPSPVVHHRSGRRFIASCIRSHPHPIGQRPRYPQGFRLLLQP